VFLLDCAGITGVDDATGRHELVKKPASEPVYACLQLPLFTVDPSRLATTAEGDRQPETPGRSLFTRSPGLEVWVPAGLPLERSPAGKRDLVAQQTTAGRAGHIFCRKIFTGRNSSPILGTDRS
jgi:hypothetical protein